MKKRFTVITAVIILAFFLLTLILPLIFAPLIHAEDVSRLQDILQDAKKRASSVKKDLDDVKKEQKTVLDEKLEIEHQIDLLEDELSEIAATLEDTEQKLEIKQQELVEATEKSDRQYTLLKARARAMYEEGDVSYLEVLINSKNFLDFLSRMEIVSEIMKHDTSLLNSLKQCRVDIENTKNQIENEKKIQQQAQQQDLAKRTQLEAALGERDRFLDVLATKQSDFESALGEWENTVKSTEQKIRQAQQAQQAKQAQQSKGSASEPVKYSGEKFGWPTKANYSITSAFGSRFHPILKTTKLHTGIDLGAPFNTEIIAAADGRVILAGNNGAYGKCVIIDHGGGLSTLYGHNNSLAVSEGQMVKRGQVLGRSGSTGLSTGPHLHFEIRENGTCVNPMKYYK